MESRNVCSIPATKAGDDSQKQPAESEASSDSDDSSTSFVSDNGEPCDQLQIEPAACAYITGQTANTANIRLQPCDNDLPPSPSRTSTLERLDESSEISRDAMIDCSEHQIHIPEELRKLKPLTKNDQEKLYCELYFDGISILSKSLEFIEPVFGMGFKSSFLKLNIKNGTHHKGHKPLYVSRVYSVPICNVGMYTANLVYTTNVFLPEKYFSESKLLAHIFALIKATVLEVRNQNDGFAYWDPINANHIRIHSEEFPKFAALFHLNVTSSYTKYCLSVKQLFLDKNIDVNMLNFGNMRYPERRDLEKELETFGQQPYCTLEKEEESYSDHVYFMLQRYGMDFRIPHNLKPMDWLESNEKFISTLENTASYLRPYLKEFNFERLSEVQMASTEICFHIARDFSVIQKNGEEVIHLFWVSENVQKQLKHNFEEFYVFALPGVANLRTIQPILKPVTFYTRLWHEIHRNEDGFFTKECQVTPMLANWLGTKLFYSTRKPSCTMKINRLLQNIPSCMLQRLVDDCSVPSQARIEINQTIRISDCVYKTLEEAFIRAVIEVDSFTTKEHNLLEPEMLLPVPSSILIKWVTDTLIPAANRLSSATQLLESSVKDLLSSLHHVYYSEFLASFLITGRKIGSFHENCVADIGLHNLSHLRVGDPFFLSNLRIRDGVLEVCDIPDNITQSKIVPWILEKYQGGTSLKVFQTIHELVKHCFPHAKGKIKENIPEELIEKCIELLEMDVLLKDCQQMFDMDVPFNLSRFEKIVSSLFSDRKGSESNVSIKVNVTIIGLSSFAEKLQGEYFTKHQNPAITVLRLSIAGLEKKCRTKKHGYVYKVLKETILKKIITESVPLYVLTVPNIFDPKLDNILIILPDTLPGDTTVMQCQNSVTSRSAIWDGILGNCYSGDAEVEHINNLISTAYTMRTQGFEECSDWVSKFRFVTAIKESAFCHPKESSRCVDGKRIPGNHSNSLKGGSGGSRSLKEHYSSQNC